MLRGEPPTPSELARLAALMWDIQLSKRGGGFVSYPFPEDAHPVRPLPLKRLSPSN